MAELKTKKTEASVEDFLNSAPENRKEDAFTLLSMFKKITKEDPKMWGPSIVGFGQYHYKSERSSQEGDWLLTGFSPRKQNLTLYVLNGFDSQEDLLKKLGKAKTSVGCLYINKLSDVDQGVLEEMIERSYKEMKKNHNVD
jgi:hypothetical protein